MKVSRVKAYKCFFVIADETTDFWKRVSEVGYLRYQFDHIVHTFDIRESFLSFSKTVDSRAHLSADVNLHESHEFELKRRIWLAQITTGLQWCLVLRRSLDHYLRTKTYSTYALTCTEPQPHLDHFIESYTKRQAFALIFWRISLSCSCANCTRILYQTTYALIIYCFIFTSAFQLPEKKQGHSELRDWTTKASPHCYSAIWV